MGKRQGKRPRKKVGSKQRAVAVAASNMTPVPLSLGWATADFTSCRHIESGVNLDKLRRQLTTNKPVQECHDCCRALNAKPKKGKPKQIVTKKGTWICLACGQIGCNAHVFEGPHVDSRVSDSHAQHYVVMEWSQSLDCVCLKCKAHLEYSSVVDPNATQPALLQRAASLLQEVLFGKASSLKAGVDHEVPEVSEVLEAPGVPETPEVPEVPEVPEGPEVEEGVTPKAVNPPLTSRRVMKGLMNLGNTCFFNSVMQNLVGVSMLREHFCKDASEPEGGLKISLRKFFLEMDPSPLEKAYESGFGCYDGCTRKTRSFEGNAVSPRGLFHAICAKAPRFKGFQQQDSHELLRCLLDGLHMEEESQRKDQSGDVKDKERKLPETLVEHMFGGQFSSTMTCCECGHSSVVYEPFLDLSLEIPSKQKVEPNSIQLAKPIAQRSPRRGDFSGNGVLIKGAGFSSFDSGLVENNKTVEAPKKSGIVPVLGFNLERGVSGAGKGEISNDHDSASEEAKKGSTTGDKDQADDSTVNPCPAKGFASSSGTEKDGDWLDFVDVPTNEGFDEIGVSSVLDSDAGATDINQPRDDEAHPLDEQLHDVPLDNGDQVEEETIEYGPFLPVATGFGPENKSECLAMVLSSSSEFNDQAVDEIPLGVQFNTNQETISNSKVEPIPLVKSLSQGSEEDGSYDVAALYADEGTYYKDGIQSRESSSFNNMDTIVAVPAYNGERTELNLGSARGVREVETYPTMSVEGCLQAFTKTEILSGENAWACENCNRIAQLQREADRLRTDKLKQLPGTEEQCSDLGQVLGEWQPVVLEGCMASMDLNSSTNSRRMVAVGDEPVEKLDLQENGISSTEQFLGPLDDKKDVEMVDGRAGVNLTVQDILDKSHNRANNTNGFQSLDCFEGPRPGKAEESWPSSSYDGKEDAGETYAMVEVASVNTDEETASCTGRRPGNDAGNVVSSANNTHSRDIVTKDRKGKASASISMAKEVIGKKKVEKEARTTVTVKRDATKRFLVSKAPLVLTVHLKRFAQDMHGRLSKLSGHITFHEQLDLSPFIDQRDGVKQGGVYQLIGTVEHSGTMRGGHYVAYVKGSKTETENDATEGTSTWYYISDSHVRKTCLEHVLQSEAYLLFYERLTIE